MDHAEFLLQHGTFPSALKRLILPMLLCLFLMGYLVPSLCAAQPEVKDLTLDTTTSVRLLPAMTLAGNNLMNMLSPSRNYLPFWQQYVDPNGYWSTTEFGWPGHNLGRWWDTMLRLEAATGYSIPPAIEQAMLQNLQLDFNNPNHINLTPANQEGAWFELHSLREGMLALNALVRYRNNAWARNEGHLMAQSLLEKINFTNGTWKLWLLDPSGYDSTVPGWYSDNAIKSHGRLMEALVWFYEATHDATVLDLVTRLAAYHFTNSTHADGSFNPTSGADHTHSYLGTLRGLLLFGELTGNQAYIDRVNVTLREYVLKQVIKKSGFNAHDLNTDGPGETSSPGDAAQLALWLADRHGQGDLWDVVERLVRARIIPSQITSTPHLNAYDTGPDSAVNLDTRILGAIGGMHDQPHSRKHNTFDVTAAATHSLIDIYQHIVTEPTGILKVNLHFDYEDARIRVTAIRTAQFGRVTIEPKKTTELRVRVPRWTPAAQVRLLRNGAPAAINMLDADYLTVGTVGAGDKVVLEYALPVTENTELARAVNFTFLWRGDEIICVRPNNPCYPFYGRYPALEPGPAGPDQLLIASWLDGKATPRYGALLSQNALLAYADRHGVPARALAFNGYSASINYQMLNFPSRNYAFTCWIKPMGLPTSGGKMFNIVSAWAALFDEPMRLFIRDGYLQGLLESGNSYYTPSVAVQNNTWYHVALVKKETQLTLYLNGNPVGQVEVPWEFFTTTDVIGVGCNPYYGGNEYFKGALDNLFFYGRALSLGEIRASMADQSSVARSTFLYE